MAFEWDTHLQRWWRQNFKDFRMSSDTKCLLFVIQPAGGRQEFLRSTDIEIKLAKLSKRHHLQERCWLPPMLAILKLHGAFLKLMWLTVLQAHILVTAHFQSNWLNFRNIIISKNVVGFRPCLANLGMSWGISEVHVWRFFNDYGACLNIFNQMWPKFQDIITSKNIVFFSSVGFQNITMMLFVKTSHGW